MPVTLVHTKTGDKVQITDPQELKQAIGSNEYEPAGGDSIVMRNLTGKPVSVKWDQIGQVLDLGYTPEGFGQAAGRAARDQLEEDYSGWERVRAFGEGGLSALTLGGYDVLAADEDYRLRAELNPGTRAVGQVVGGLASAGAMGSGSVANLLRATPGGTAVRLAEAGGAKIAGRLAGQSGLRRVVGYGAAGVLEGGMFEAGQAVSQAVLDDKPLTVESLASHMGTGMLLGGGIGTAFGGAAEGLLRLRKIDTLGEQFHSHINRVDSAVDDALKGADELAGRKAAEAAAPHWQSHYEEAVGVPAQQADEVVEKVADLGDTGAGFAKGKPKGKVIEVAPEEAARVNFEPSDLEDFAAHLNEQGYRGYRNVAWAKLAANKGNPRAGEVSRVAFEKASKLQDELDDIFFNIKGRGGKNRQPLSAEELARKFNDDPDLLERTAKLLQDHDQAHTNLFNQIEDGMYDGLNQVKIRNKRLKGEDVAKTGHPMAGPRLDHSDFDPLGQLRIAQSRAKAWSKMPAEMRKRYSGSMPAQAAEDLKKSVNLRGGRTRPKAEPQDFYGPRAPTPEDLSVNAAQGARHSVETAAQALRSARKELRKQLGESFDLGKLIRQKPEQATAIAQAVDEYALTAKAWDDLAGTELSTALGESDALLKSIGVHATAEGRGLISKVSKVNLEDATKVAGIKTLPELQSAAGEFILKAYAYGRIANTPGKLGRAARWLGKNAAGAAVGGMVGGPLGAVAGGSPLVRRVVMNALGNPASHIASAMRKLEGTTNKIKKLIGRFAARATNKDVPRAVIPSAVATLEGTRFWHEQEKGRSAAESRMLELSKAVSNKPGLRAALDERLNELRAHNLPLAFAVANKAEERVDFLYSKMPSFSTTVFGQPLELPSKAEIAEWSRYVRAAENPLTLLEDLNARNITPEAVEAVKTLYPELFEYFKGEVMEQLSEHRAPLPYQDRLQIGYMFEVSLDDTTSPDVYKTLQEMYQQKQQAQQQGGALPQGVSKLAEQPTKGARLTER